ncbi:hypothetical protein OSSY52_16540 [Tepiditoga spiralis]|uniref:histidine kinase n=1 Tax=Tepiditoga spiralis TaxID=2108365 RepID=A0A7G1G988_9BACT|nr:ATP-binding protein [Tepiditoga spiralis]BBE31513.1 hypothetical protein OSSY52_16540 [Tepiditoga spiralis]
MTKSFKNKIIFISITLLFLALIIELFISFYGIKKLADNSEKELKIGMQNIYKEYYTNYLNSASNLIESKIKNIFENQAIAGSILQEYFDNNEDFKEITKTMIKNDYSKDKLKFNGRWYQNDSTQNTVVLVQRYCLNKDNSIRDDVLQQIHDTSILNLVLPAIYNNSSNLLWIYFSGRKNGSFMRIYPWNDVGNAMDKVYPAHTDVPNWEAFNPGLVEQFEEKRKNNSNLPLKDFSIIKGPTQDGGTGKIIMTLNYPIWDKARKKFEGSLSVDVTIQQIIDYIKEFKVVKNGFGFISQSNGNVFAINDMGIKTLGLKGEKESTIYGKKGVGYNPMKRYFKDSKYESIKNLSLTSSSAKTVFKNIVINNKKYILVMKNLNSFNTWNKNKGFYKESWTLGFFLPEESLYQTLVNSQNTINSSTQNILKYQTTIIVILVFIIGIILYYVLSKSTKNLEYLVDATQSISKGNYDFKLDIKSKDEFGKLGSSFNKMKDEIKESFKKIETQNAELKKLNDELEFKVLERTKSLNNLLEKYQKTQKQLVETEKMASLGKIVAGVAHEINTPLGISVTTVSHLKDKTKSLEKDFLNNELKKSTFENYIKDTLEISDITMFNLRRASELIQKFKKVSVETSNDIKTNFNLKDYINNTILILNKKLKQKNIEVLIKGKNIELKGYPGDWYQIINNLIMNSIIHGFENKKNGKISISFEEIENNIELIYIDNGSGIEKEIIDKIFEPFFTTKMGKGGSGLGLNLIYNLVTQKMKGSIKCESEIGKGVKFIINIPKNI